jgi:hypothetical protein
LVRRERKGKRRGAAGFAVAAAGRRGRGEEERKGDRERPTSGAQASARAKKKKKRQRGRGPARGEGWRAARLFGPKGEKVRFSLFFFSFSNSFLKQPFFSNSNQTLSNFFSKIL